MIVDFVFGLLVEFVGFVSRALPAIPLGPLAPSSTLWTQLGQLGGHMGWVGSVVPWSSVGVAAGFYMSCAGVALMVWLVRFVLRVLRFNV